MKICSQNPEHDFHLPGAKFCARCGGQLIEEPDRKCDCGQVLTKSQPYCHACGKKAA